MKWTLVIRQKLKVALLMSLAMAVIIITNLVSRSSINAADHAIASIYNDRLVPATDLFQITEKLHQKRFMMDKILLAETSSVQNDLLLKKTDKQIKNLISKFEHTYLVDLESENLKLLKLNLSAYNKLESDALNLIELNKLEEAEGLYYSKARPAHEKSIEALIELNKIQSVVGNEIIKNSKFTLSISTLFSTIQIVLAIIIGTCIIKLVAASKLVNQTQDRFNLN